MVLHRIKDLLASQYIYVILIIFWIISSAASPYFRTMDTFGNILTSAVPIALISLGQTVVVISRGFDLSVGAVASMATAIASVTLGENILLAFVLVIAAAVVVGWINGLGITKLKIDPFIMTLCMMFLLTGLNFLIRPSPGGVIPPLYKQVLLYEVGDFPVTAFIILIITATYGYITLKRRKFGRNVYAIGGEPEYARMEGVPVDTVLIRVYILSAVVSALAGLFIAARISSGNAEAGAPYLFDSFITVFMGGTPVTGGVGGYSGTLGAALIISSIGQILQFLGVDIWYHFIIKGVLLASVAGLQLYFTRIRKGAR
jgi:ribose transport system permease protein